MAAFLKDQCWDRQEMVISEAGWNNTILTCMTFCLGSCFLAGCTTEVVSCELLIDLLEESRSAVVETMSRWYWHGKQLREFSSQPKCITFYWCTADQDWILERPKSNIHGFQNSEPKQTVDRRRIWHFHCNLAILVLGLNTLGTVPYVLIRFALICSRSRLGRILTIRVCCFQNEASYILGNVLIADLILL